MQQRMWRAGQPIARTALCVILPTALWGCSPDLAIGDVSAQDQALDQAPSPEPSASASAGGTLEDTIGLADTSAAPRSDFTVAAQLPKPDVTMRIDVVGSGEVAVSGVGDLDGDGFADFASVGTEFTNDSEFIHIRYGGPRPARAGDAFALEQSGVRLLLGPFINHGIEAISPAGDVDGDGYADLLVGLGICDPARASEGAYLLYGGPERLSGVLHMDEVAALIHDPREPERSSQSACSVGFDSHLAALGDFDGDGFDDFVLADQRASGTTTAYLFYGSAQRLANGTSMLDADAQFHSEGDLVPAGTGDVNGDGTGDLLLSVRAPTGEASSFFLPGSSERRQGELDTANAGTSLGALIPFTSTGSHYPRPAINPAVLSPPDLDGDGVADLLLYGGDGTSHLFYGDPGLFAGEVDLSQSVVLENDADVYTELWFAGDRDGDGDAELVARFDNEEGFPVSDVAFLSGSRQRASGRLVFPVQSVLQANPSSSLSEESRFLDGIIIAGDLDGDGASDLLTTSSWYDIESSESGGYNFLISEAKLHIHYGVPGNASATLH